MSGPVVLFSHKRGENHHWFFPVCPKLCSMPVMLESVASLLLPTSIKKYTCWETSLSLSCFPILQSIWKRAKSSTVPLQTCWEMFWFKERQLLPHVPPGTGKWCATSQKARVFFHPRCLWISLFAWGRSILNSNTVVTYSQIFLNINNQLS